MIEFLDLYYTADITLTFKNLMHEMSFIWGKILLKIHKENE